MSELDESLKSDLLRALAESDERRRLGRADRILWMSAIRPQAGVIVGPLDTMTILNEARDCFIEGHYVATVLLATAFIEHILVDELSERELGRPRTFSAALDAATENRLFPNELLSQTRDFSLIRNAFTHRKPSDDPNGFGYRFKARRVHPTRILEEDAKQSLVLMYEYFRLTLNESGA